MRDLRHAWRSLAATPVLSAIVAASLAIGIGANTVIFSWLQVVRWKPLPAVSGAASFYTIEPKTDAGVYLGSSWLDFRDLRPRLKSFEWLEAFRMTPLTVGEAPNVTRAAGLFVSGGYFRSLGLKPAIGRLLEDADVGVPRERPVLVISDDYWRSHFAASPSVVGSHLRVNTLVFTVVGVAPPRFQGTTLGLAFDIWMPATMAPAVVEGSSELEDRSQRGYVILGRLRPGVHDESAQRELDAAMRELSVTYPQTNTSLGAELASFTTPPRGPQRMIGAALVFLQVLMALVLVAVCSNVANLMVAKISARQREFGTRLALGASRFRASKLILVETSLLALAGTAGGLLLATWGLGILQIGQLAIPLPVRFQVGIDGTALAFAIGAGILATILIAGAPMLFLGRLQPYQLVRDGISGGGRRTGFGQVLTGVQVALASLVLATAALFVGRFQETRGTDPGFKAAGVLLAAYDLAGRVTTTDQNRDFASRALAAARSIPGVSSAALASSVPLDIHGLPSRPFTIEGRARPDAAEDRALSIVVSDGYLETMGVRLLEGRDVGRVDGATDVNEAIVNEAFVERYLPGQPVIGRRLQSRGTTYVIVGVSATTVSEAFGEPPTPLVLYSFAASPGSMTEIHLRTAPGMESAVSSSLLRTFQRMDATVPLYNIRTLEQHITTNLVLRRVPAQMFLVLGPLLLFLAASGVYAVVDYGVSQRTSEIGVRLALGARPWQVVRVIVAETMSIAAVSVVGATAIVTLIDLHLVRGGTRDLPALVVTPLLLLTVAAIAGYLPARRASLVNPTVAMREP
jgi:predicted permease